jgi:PhnB protein
MQVQPYVFFDGRCEEALAFYGDAIDARVEMLLRFKDNPDPPAPGCEPPDGDRVMHASVRIGDSVVMMSDGNAVGQPAFEGFSLSLTVADAAEAQRRFAALGEGGQVVVPLGKTFFSPQFGMLVDRFGVHWMVLVPA